LFGKIIMKKLILLLAVFAITAFAQQHGGHSAPSHNAQPIQHSAPATRGWNRFGQPGGYRPILPVKPPVIIVRPGFGFYGGFGWNYYYSLGFWPYY
jgi:hypothetical protein